MHFSNRNHCCSCAGSAAASRDGNPVIKELALKCFDPTDPAEAFLRNYVQRQAWRDEEGDGSPLPVL